ncbi:hypothetical protein Asppvi_010057 [Aspergillus pseudoviridinutans]|uniref:Zn(2)-C6 fungal-type domain-containing protein n=1 Tax=Aspergillus pseudoviridinutans TaxID=1517512 RepID=A0A9P3BH57_9EURO|nr:uncharacterized protein Asppvi_010057 [Aspergillus pseudoviridinutans]GIJ91092.1 hypothetical protein Asppvi_010057 [Aspergillus pseudoviridinutans]
MPVQRLLRRSPLQCSQCSELEMECSKTRPQCDGCRRHRLSCRYGNSVPSKPRRPHSGVRASRATPSKAKASSSSDDSSSSSSSSSYSSPSPPAQQYPPAASPSTSHSPESNISEVEQDDKSKVLEAEAGKPSEDLNPEDQCLLDNWCNSTQQSLAHSKSRDHPWQAIIRRETSKHPALRHSTLALSAIELASTSEAGTPQRERHLQAARNHYTQATEKLPNILETPTASGPNAAFSTASILFMCDLASSALAGEGSKSVLPSLDNQTPTSQTESPDPSPSSSPSLQKLLDLFDTIRALLPSPETLNKVENGAMKDLFTHGDPYHQLPSTYTLTILSMKNLNAVSAKKDPLHETAVYNDTIANLDNSLEMLTKGGDPTTIALRWMFRIPARYLDLVREEQPLALIIFAHYCAVLHHLRDRWWMGDLGARLLKEICRLLGPERMGSILWATDIVGIQT